LRAVHARLANRFAIPPSQQDADALALSVGDWPPFPDTVAALRRLKSRYRLLITSNIDRDSFARSSRLLQVEFDAIITAQDVGTYKPAPGHFHRAAETLSTWGIDRDDWLHVAQSLYHDHTPAKRLGIATCWIDRRAGRSGGATPPPPSDLAPDHPVPTLAAFADACEMSPAD
ncbi:MAG: HAD-IA family hydrolase, partial [Planctomycetota bacterium]|nr:HAD-IA family hydrolase [Planctomycetota bacterium]